MKHLFVILLVLCPYVSCGLLQAQIHTTSSSAYHSYSTSGIGTSAPIEFRSTSIYHQNTYVNKTKQYSTAPMQIANGNIKTIASSIKGGVLSDSDETGYIPLTKPQRAPGVPDTVPLQDGWDVALLLALLCVGYVVWKYMSVKRLKG